MDIIFRPIIADSVMQCRFDLTTKEDDDGRRRRKERSQESHEFRPNNMTRGSEKMEGEEKGMQRIDDGKESQLPVPSYPPVSHHIHTPYTSVSSSLSFFLSPNSMWYIEHAINPVPPSIVPSSSSEQQEFQQLREKCSPLLSFSPPDVIIVMMIVGSVRDVEAKTRNSSCSFLLSRWCRTLEFFRWSALTYTFAVKERQIEIMVV